MLEDVVSQDDEAGLVAAIDAAAAEASAPQSVKAPAGPRSVTFLVGVLAGGNVASSALRMLGGILQARLTPPAVLGLFNGIGLVLGYTRFLQLGILNGLNRELPYFIGQGDHKRTNELAAAAAAWAILLGGVVGLGLGGVSLWCLIRGEWWLAAGWAANAVAAFIFFYGTMYLQATYRTTHDFARLSVVNVVQSAVALVLVGLIALMSFYGLCLRAAFSGLIGLAILYYWRPLRVSPRWNWRDLRHLLIIGLPIFGVGELAAFLTTFDSTLVLHYLGKEGMGLYAMVLVAGTTLELLPLAVGQVMYPRMAEHYGRTHNLATMMTMTIKPSLCLVAGMVPLVVVAWILAGPLTRLILPKYVEAIPAMQWNLLLPFVLSFTCVHNVYNICRRQDLYAIAILISMAAYAGAVVWLNRNGAYLAAFPQSLLVGRIVYVLGGYAFLVPLYRSWRLDQSREPGAVSK
ncbi:MAG: oligosaccharide flippase family protein [Thermoguttaceae bacterium]|jgi:O-antigen/teichoic acid export membrane protein